MTTSYREITYSSSGAPAEVLTYRIHDGLPPPPSSEGWTRLCRVDLLNAPWNPADAMAVQGMYASPYPDQNTKRDALGQSPFHPESKIPGAQAIGRIVEITTSGSDQKESEAPYDLQVGDWVAVGQPGLGTMRSAIWVPDDCLLRLDRGEELFERVGPQACSLVQLGGTAIRMLRDFVALQPGDVVLQNAGNSSVGYMVSQLANLHMNVSVVSLVRKGSKTPKQWTELVQHMMENGKCRLVAAEEDLQDEQGLKTFQSELEKLGNGKLPRLALDSVGGPSASVMLSCLGMGGTIVTYGSLSRQPVVLSSSHLIYKDMRALGFWFSRWMVEHSVTERYEMLNELVQSLLDEGVTCPPVQVFPLSQVKQALEWDATQQSSLAVRRKIVWDCQN